METDQIHASRIVGNAEFELTFVLVWLDFDSVTVHPDGDRPMTEAARRSHADLVAALSARRKQ